MDKTHGEIALFINKSQSSVSREIANNRVEGVYDSRKANHKYYARRHNARFQFSAISQNKALNNYIVHKLKSGLSPQATSGRMRSEKQPFYASKTAIYDWLYTARGQKYCKHLLYRHYDKRKRKTVKVKRSLIPHRVSISKRKTLDRYDYEGDAVVSKKSRTALVVIHNPVTMYGDVRRVPDLKPVSALEAFRKMLKRVRAHSITFDNGQENRLHLRLNITTYFCDPHAPWQKPGIENMNRFIRKYIPKGSDISLYSHAYIKKIVQTYNNRPKEKIGWKTPDEVMRRYKLYANEKNRAPRKKKEK